MKLELSRVTNAATRFWRSRVGRLRTSTVVLIVAFFALWWLQQTYQPEPAPPQAPQVVPPGFVPDPDYTWVPRTNVEAPRTTRTTTPTTTTTTTTPTPTPETPTTTPTAPPAPGETTSPTSPDGPTTTTEGPQTTVVDPDGAGILPPITLPVLPGAAPAPAPVPAPEPVAPAPPQ